MTTMKPKQIVGFSLVASLLSVAGWCETFIGPSSATNRLIIATNEAIFATGTFFHPSVYTNTSPTDPFITLRIIAGGKTNDIFGLGSSGGNPQVLAGPAEVVSKHPVLINFKRTLNAGIQTIFFESNSPPVRVSVNTNQTVRFFAESDQMEIAFTRGALQLSLTNISFASPTYEFREFDGPLEADVKLRVIPFVPPPGAPAVTNFFPIGFVSYVVTDSQQIQQPGGVLQSLSGRSVIAVEKSANLTNWNTTILQDVGEASKSFYRLSISR